MRLSIANPAPTGSTTSCSNYKRNIPSEQRPLLMNDRITQTSTFQIFSAIYLKDLSTYDGASQDTFQHLGSLGLQSCTIMSGLCGSQLVPQQLKPSEGGMATDHTHVTNIKVITFYATCCSAGQMQRICSPPSCQCVHSS